MHSAFLKNLVGRVKKTKTKSIEISKFNYYVLKAGKIVLIRRKNRKEMMTLAKAVATQLKIKLIKHLKFKPCTLVWDEAIENRIGWMIHCIMKTDSSLNRDWYNEVVNEFVLYFMKNKAPKFRCELKLSPPVLLDKMERWITYLFRQKIWEMISKVKDEHTIKNKRVSYYTNIALKKSSNNLKVFSDPLEALEESESPQGKNEDFGFEESENRVVQEELVKLFGKWLLNNKNFSHINKRRYFEFLFYGNKISSDYLFFPKMRNLFQQFHKETYGVKYNSEFVF